MDQSELYRLCGLTSKEFKSPPAKWHRAKLLFIGADRYVLRAETVDVQFTSNNGGLTLRTTEPLMVPSNSLLGPKGVHGTLYDVQVVTEVITLSLASLNPELYPKILRNDEEVRLL